MAGRARFTMVVSSPTMNRLEQHMARTSSRRRRARSGTGLPRSAASMVSDAYVNVRFRWEFLADRAQVHEVTAHDQTRLVVGGGGRGELRAVQRRVPAAGREQGVVRAPLHHTTVLDHRDLVRGPDGGEPVRD